VLLPVALLSLCLPGTPATDVTFVPQVASSNVSDLAVSADGRLAATSDSMERTVHVWEVATRKLVAVLRVDERSTNKLAFTADNARLVGIGDGLVTWDLATKQVVQKVPLPLERVENRGINWLLSANAKTAAREHAGKVQVWDVASGRETRSLRLRAPAYIALSPDGSLLSANSEGRLRVIDLKDGRTLREIASPGPLFYHALSADGRWVAGGNESGMIVEMASGAVIPLPKLNGDPRFSPDGTQVVVPCDTRLEVWSTSPAALRYSIPKVAYHASFTPDGRSVLWTNAYQPGARTAAEGRGQLYIATLGQGSERAFSVALRGLFHLGVSSDERRILFTDFDEEVHSFDLDKLEPNPPLGRAEKLLPDASAAIYKNGAQLVWRELPSGIERTLPVLLGEARLSAIFPEQDLVVGLIARYGLDDKYEYTIVAWELRSGQLLASLKAGEAGESWGTFAPVDAKRLLAGSSTGRVALLDLEAKKVVRIFEGAAQILEDASALAVSPDGRWVGSLLPNELRVHEIATGKQIAALPWKAWFNPHGGLAFSPDGRVLAAGSTDGKVVLYDVASKKIARTLEGHLGSVNGVRFTKDGQRLFTTSSDGSVRRWDLTSDRWLAYVASDTKWVFYTSDGDFDASHDGAPLLAMVRGTRAMGIDQFAIGSNRPDHILERFGLGDPETIARYKAAYERRLRRAGLDETALSQRAEPPVVEIASARLEGNSVMLAFSAADKNGALRSYNVYVNDVPVFGAYGKPVQGPKATLTERVALTPGKNKIEVSATNRSGVESYRALVDMSSSASVPEDLYFVGFGISKYRDPALTLDYARKDAEDLAKVFGRAKGRYRNVLVKTLTDDAVTSEAIKQAKSFLAKASVADTVILFIAGHGVQGRGKDAAYYYLMHDTDLARLESTAISFEQIEDLLQGIAPRKKLFLMDTCESGEREEETEASPALAFAALDGTGKARGIKVHAKPPIARRATYTRDRFIYNDLVRRSGAVVFSSSRGGELSYEFDNLKNGAFTYAIIQAFTGERADADASGTLTVPELRPFVEQEVMRLTGGRQHPTIDRDNITIDLQLPTLGR
jgi:WD40 repeat protein